VCWLLDRPISADCFLAYIENVLLPTLRRRDLVIVDNLQSHKHRAIRDALTQAGASASRCNQSLRPDESS
jgi:putative transposase